MTGNTDNIILAELERAPFYFYCAKNEANSYPVPERLFKKIIKRHEKLKDNPDAKFYHFYENYNYFSKAYPLDN